MNFGGSITVDVSLLPKDASNITLMTFNCSAGNFTLVGGINNLFCTQQELHYFRRALVLDLIFDGCHREGGDSIPTYLWISLGVGLFVVIVIGMVVLLLLLKKKDLSQQDEKFERW